MQRGKNETTHKHNTRKLNVSGHSRLCSADDNQLLMLKTQTNADYYYYYYYYYYSYIWTPSVLHIRT